MLSQGAKAAAVIANTFHSITGRPRLLMRTELHGGSVQNNATFELTVIPTGGRTFTTKGVDHIPQSRVAGMEIEKQEMFDFVSKIQEHRRSKKTLQEIFAFTVEGTK